jgi:hypothetical protein
VGGGVIRQLSEVFTPQSSVVSNPAATYTSGISFNLRHIMIPTHEHLADSMQAKRFLVSRIVEEAERQHEPLSDVEEKMLYFSETCPTLPHVMDVAERFENEVDSGKYEDKISRLAKGAYRHDSQESPGNTALWKEAVTILNKEDHYILVMLGFRATSSFPSKVTTNKDQWRLLGYGLLTAVLMALVVISMFSLNLNLPLWGGALILVVIGGAVFRLSKYMERRSK